MDGNNDWQGVYCGRDEELQFLKDKWKQVSNSENPKPQVAVLLAESGMGKTRLVQEFYGWLSENEDKKHYWPSKLTITGDNLMVNPNVDAFSNKIKKLPYLWWGIRFSDPAGHNNQVVSHLSGHLDSLALHLQPLYQARFDLHKKTDAMKLLMGVFTLHVYDHVQTVIDTASMLTDAIKQWRKIKTNNKETAEPSHKRHESVFTDLKDVLQKPSQSTLEKLGVTHADIINVPMILWLDDAQWADEEMLSLVRALLREANKSDWPLMIIATHWEREWAENKNQKGHSFVKLLLEETSDVSIESMIKVFGDNRKLDDTLNAALPGLSEGQVSRVLDKCDGNPRALTELIHYAKSNKALFEGRNSNSALTEGGAEHLANQSLSIDAATDKRFANLPNDIKDFINLGSLQGTVFSDDISKAVLKTLWKTECGGDVAIKAELPYVVTKKISLLSSEFRGRALYIRAHEAMKLNDADYQRAKILTLQEIEKMTVDGRWIKLNIEDQQRLRSLYKDMTDNDYIPIYPEAKRTLEAEYAQDKGEMVYEAIFAIKKNGFVSPLKDNDWEDEVRTISNENMQEHIVDMLDDQEQRDEMLESGFGSNNYDSSDELSELLYERSQDEAWYKELDEMIGYSFASECLDEPDPWEDTRMYIPANAMNIIEKSMLSNSVILGNSEPLAEWLISGDYGVIQQGMVCRTVEGLEYILCKVGVPFVRIGSYEKDVHNSTDFLSFETEVVAQYRVYCPHMESLKIEAIDVENILDIDILIEGNNQYKSDDSIFNSIGDGIAFKMWHEIIDWDTVKTKLTEMLEEEALDDLCLGDINTVKSDIEGDSPF